MSIDLRRDAERISFRAVPETCPIIDAELDAIDLNVPLTKDKLEGLRTLIKSRTMALRDLSFKYIEMSLVK